MTNSRARKRHSTTTGGGKVSRFGKRHSIRHLFVVRVFERHSNGVIVYGLGNFVFDGFSGAGAESVILNVTLSRAGVRSFSLTPVVLSSGCPRLVDPQAAAAIIQRIERLSTGE